jgi:hypothetical protein
MTNLWGEHDEHALTEQQRSEILDAELFGWVRGGARVQARTATQAVVTTGKPVNHILHLLVSVLCCGAWLPVWALVTAFGGIFSRTLTIDENGEVHDSYAVARRDRIVMWIVYALIVLIVVNAVAHWRW